MGRFAQLVLFSCLVAFKAAAAQAGGPFGPVLVTGADGRTGSLIYHLLKTQSDAPAPTVRAGVRSLDTQTKARLNCTKCDPSEGIYVLDVTKPHTLTAAFDGVRTVLCAVGAGENDNQTQQEKIEFFGVQNQVAALAAGNPKVTSLSDLTFVLCSSMGTTNPKPLPFEGGSVLFWKLNAETFLGTCGVTTAVIKPGGLVDQAGGNSTLLAGHDDSLLTKVMPPLVARADVAAVMVAAAVQVQKTKRQLRFDLVSKPGDPTDPADVLRDALWPWQR